MYEISVIKSNVTNAVNIIEGGQGVINKRGKMGSLAALMAFGTKDQRLATSQGLHIKQIINKQYRPFVRDFMASKMLADETLGLISYKVGDTGPIRDEVMSEFCAQALHALEAKLARGKTPKRIDDLKGEKLYYAKMLEFICKADREALTIEA
jgi:hypothetical protein